MTILYTEGIEESDDEIFKGFVAMHETKKMSLCDILLKYSSDRNIGADVGDILISNYNCTLRFSPSKEDPFKWDMTVLVRGDE